MRYLRVLLLVLVLATFGRPFLIIHIHAASAYNRFGYIRKIKRLGLVYTSVRVSSRGLPFRCRSVDEILLDELRKFSQENCNFNFLIGFKRRCITFLPIVAWMKNSSNYNIEYNMNQKGSLISRHSTSGA